MSGHAEVVRVMFDPSLLSYEELLERWFLRLHDPTTLNRQGNDDRTRLHLVQRGGVPPGLPAEIPADTPAITVATGEGTDDSLGFRPSRTLAAREVFER